MVHLHELCIMPLCLCYFNYNFEICYALASVVRLSVVFLSFLAKEVESGEHPLARGYR
jgi:hypothetical protein